MHLEPRGPTHIYFNDEGVTVCRVFLGLKFRPKGIFWVAKKNIGIFEYVFPISSNQQ